MKRIAIEQGSEAWHLYRATHIMSTCAAIIMDESPYDSPLSLWKRKLGFTPPVQENESMRRGSLLEPEARELANEVYGIEYTAAVIEDSEHPWRAASLDGISTCGKCLLEIKCGKRTHLEAIEGIIPQYYKIQMLHALSVTGAQYCRYFSYDPDHETPYASWIVGPDPAYQRYMLEEERKFYDCLVNFKEPK